MEEIIKCKYKFQNNEKFNGKVYCTLFNELCENIYFVCDTNCQVFEDYKQLKRLEQENEELKATIKELTQSLDDCNVQRTKLYKKLDFEMQKREEFADKSIKYKFALEEIMEIANQTIIDYTEIAKNNEKLKALDLRNRMSEIQNIITEAIG